MSAREEGGPVGVDIGGTTIRAVAFAGDLAVDDVVTRPTPSGIEALVDAVVELVAAVGPERPELVAVGLPGRVDADAATVADAVNLGIVGAVPIGRLLAARTAARVHVENDVNAAALGTFAHFGSDPASSLAYVNVGTGIAAGFVVGGRVLRGATGGAGEIGHLPMWPNGPRCRCGQRGCAEAVGSGRAVGREGGLVERAVAATAWSVQLCALVLDVDVVAVGGGLTERDGFFDHLGDALTAIERSSPMLAGAGLARRVRPAPAGDSVGSLGAVLAARSSRS